MWFRQIAQLSTTMSHAQSATAFHFFTSNLFLPSLALSAGPDFDAFAGPFGFEELATSASGISMSAMTHRRCLRDRSWSTTKTATGRWCASGRRCERAFVKVRLGAITQVQKLR